MRFTRSHYQTCLEADLLTDSSRLRSSKHDSSASVVCLDRAASVPLKFQANRVRFQACLSFVFCAVTLASALGR